MSARAIIEHLDHASRAPASTDERTHLPLVNTSQMPRAPSAKGREEGGVGPGARSQDVETRRTLAIEPEAEDALTTPISWPRKC